MLAVSDTGSGMTSEVKARVFEPFFTTKGVGKGTGLGMAVVHGIVKQSGGSIDLYSELGLGTVFRLYFPVVSDPSLLPDSAGPSAVERGSETILLVEDEEGVRHVTMFILKSYGYHVLDASNGRHALEVLKSRQVSIDLLVTDIVMPEMGGGDLAKVLQTKFPGIRVLFLSGYTNDAVVTQGILHEEVAFLQKPFSAVALARKVREVLDSKE